MAEAPHVVQALPSLSEPGKYVVGEKLATGGMAEVYKGWLRGSEGFRRAVVIKKMLPRLAGDPRFVRMFIEEARTASRLVHANIVQVLDFGRLNDEHFIVLEFVDGPNLNDLILKARQAGVKRLPLPLVVYLVGETLKGLDYAHRLTDSRGQCLGCVHRDVSPSNLLLSRDGQVKLSDFGVAKAADRANWTAPGQIKGKLHYLSPEQVRGDNVDPRADVFAVGVLLHELLTGRRLFGGETPMQVMDATLNAPVPPPSTRAHDVPAELDLVALRALERERGKRFPDAETFHHALMQAVAPHFAPGRSRDLVALLDRLYGPPPAQAEDPLAALVGATPSIDRMEPTQPIEGAVIGVLAATAVEMPMAAVQASADPTVPVMRPVALLPQEPTRKAVLHPPVAQRDDRPRAGVPAPVVAAAPDSPPIAPPAADEPSDWSLGGPTSPDGHPSANSAAEPAWARPPAPVVTATPASLALSGEDARRGVWLAIAALAALVSAVIAYFAAV